VLKVGRGKESQTPVQQSLVDWTKVKHLPNFVALEGV